MRAKFLYLRGTRRRDRQTTETIWSEDGRSADIYYFDESTEPRGGFTYTIDGTEATTVTFTGTRPWPWWRRLIARALEFVG